MSSPVGASHCNQRVAAAHGSLPRPGCALRCGRCGHTIRVFMVVGTNHRVQCAKCGTVWKLEVYERPASIPPTSGELPDAAEYPTNQAGIEAGHNVKGKL